MARKNPVGRLAETAFSTIKDPKGAAGKVVDQAKGTVALGRLVAETAGSVAGQVAVRAADQLRGRSGRGAGHEPARPSAPNLRPVPSVGEQGAPAKKHGDVLETPSETRSTTATAAPATQKAPAKKAPTAKKSPAKKAPATAAPTAKKAPAAKKSTRKAPTKKVTATPADVAEVVEAPAKKAAAKKAPAKKTAAKKTPAKKTAAKKTAAKKSSPGDKLPARKRSTPEAGAATAPAEAPTSAAELAAQEGGDVVTPSGIPAAAEGANPSTGETGLEQPGTEPLVDPATAKQVASRSRTLQQAAEKEPGADEA